MLACHAQTDNVISVFRAIEKRQTCNPGGTSRIELRNRRDSMMHESSAVLPVLGCSNISHMCFRGDERAKHDVANTMG